MKRIIATFIAVLSITGLSFSQQWKTAPLELYGGISNLLYFGDIGGASSESSLMGIKDFRFSKIRPGITLGARYQVMKPLTLRASYTLGVLTQSDLNSRNESRNFAFRTLINEFTIGAEFYIIPESDENYYYSIMQIRGGLRHYKQPFSLYATLGAGALLFNVTPKEDLVTSPRFNDTKSFTMVIPVGIGCKYAIMPKISIGAELLLRLTTTDFIDGYTSQFSESNDLYYSLNIKVNYKIQKSRRRNIGLPRRRLF
ncbi:MAG: DUF6089 family protein [Bacteroidales bacterium]|nr:DUF6089 family protein [Bacteroidales bacterium]MDD4385024.1 DUF6089 family protein [Bacteroidales bacterium]MDY0196668.1 DUF6089 family protein [Tenuifilaceae bacterium]